MEEQFPREDTQYAGESPSMPGFAIVVMGVSGSGKSTVGQVLSKRVGCPFIDADDFHSEENKEKMRNGIPLTEEDRLPWLEDLRNELGTYTSKGDWVVLACSALRPQYRNILLTADYPNQVQGQTIEKEYPHGNVKVETNRSTRQVGKVVFAYLKGPAELFASRLSARHKEGNHFMPPSLLQSQLDLLEITNGDHDIITLDASSSPEEIIDTIMEELAKRI
ncbi:unnamed protein product [Calypogeia fissa]